MKKAIVYHTIEVQKHSIVFIGGAKGKNEFLPSKFVTARCKAIYGLAQTLRYAHKAKVNEVHLAKGCKYGKIFGSVAGR